eukprot:CAMPEP_0176219534 /NCGR_PEP_ID=MMETSP0121_2-20121125/18757_1 /TAXON_ID=160619 /ORGANISM="Kryptoperidinium foliaceum, Strain CCMP 1326" /LENGTH=155 /DNA_ID=CAMNT_0017558697 /DNA_START=56 /DNA_END=526 /DNA_ORIENTATION=+
MSRKRARGIAREWLSTMAAQAPRGVLALSVGRRAAHNTGAMGWAPPVTLRQGDHPILPTSLAGRRVAALHSVGQRRRVGVEATLTDVSGARGISGTRKARPRARASRARHPGADGLLRASGKTPGDKSPSSSVNIQNDDMRWAMALHFAQGGACA